VSSSLYSLTASEAYFVHLYGIKPNAPEDILKIVSKAVRFSKCDDVVLALQSFLALYGKAPYHFLPTLTRPTECSLIDRNTVFLRDQFSSYQYKLDTALQFPTITLVNVETFSPPTVDNKTPYNVPASPSDFTLYIMTSLKDTYAYAMLYINAYTTPFTVVLPFSQECEIKEVEIRNRVVRFTARCGEIQTTRYAYIKKYEGLDYNINGFTFLSDLREMT
jgi:hypothetical protein